MQGIQAFSPSLRCLYPALEACIPLSFASMRKGLVYPLSTLLPFTGVLYTLTCIPLSPILAIAR